MRPSREPRRKTGQSYFVSSQTADRKPLFRHSRWANLFLEVLEKYRTGYLLHAYVLMPDHIHLLVSFPPEKILSQVVGLWKRGLSRTHGISWQRNFFEHRLRNDESIQQKSDYLLNNPVRAGLINDAMAWPYTWLSNR